MGQTRIFVYTKSLCTGRVPQGMTQFTRRAALYGVAAGGTAALAGCTEASDPVPGGNGTDGGDGNGGDGGDEPVDDVETTVQQVGGALSGPAWDRRERRGICVLIEEANGDAGWLLNDAPEEVRAFVEETDFCESRILYVESVGPDTCHDEIAFDSVGMGVEDGTFVADATVQGPGSDDVACGQAITYPGALLRVTSDPLPESARVSLTDGWGETGTVRSGDGVRDPERLAGGVRPDGDPPNVPASFDCDIERAARHPQLYEGGVNRGRGGGSGWDGDGDGPLTLRVVPDLDRAAADEVDGTADDLTISRRDRFGIELTNVSGETAYVGSREKYNLELLTEAGWTEVRATEGDPTIGYDDIAIAVPPGGTLTWKFEMNESGLVGDEPNAGGFRVCPDLVPGRYRFVFSGAADLAVAFDYEG